MIGFLVLLMWCVVWLCISCCFDGSYLWLLDCGFGVFRGPSWFCFYGGSCVLCFLWVCNMDSFGSGV